MSNKISRLIKRMTEEPFPADGSLYDLGLGDGKLYQTEDGYTFHAVGDVSLLRNGCSGANGNGVCSTTLKVPTTTHIQKGISEKPSIFSEIVGREPIKEELLKAVTSNKTLHTLLVGPPGCGKTEFLLKIKGAFVNRSEFVDGSYGSKAGIVNLLLEKEPRYLLIDEIDKLEERDQIALFNLMQTGIISKTLKSERIEKKMTVTLFATANTDEILLPPLLSRFFAMYLHEYTDEQFKELAVKSVAQKEQITPEVAMHIAVSVLRKLNSTDLRDVIKIAQRATTIEEVDKVINTLIECSKENSKRG
jgi:Holliday junction DNA helicase RuvB